MKTTIAFIICIALPLFVGSISGFATASNINGWYVTLNKPSFNPPNYLFGPVWTTLYVLMGVSLFMIWKMPVSEMRTNALIVFGIQLALNFFWSFIFFYFQQLGWALVEIVLMWIMILVMIISFYKLNATAGLLQIPYLCWVSFATVLNAAIWKLN